MLRALLISIGSTVVALLVWGVAIVVLARLDVGADLQLSGTWTVLTLALYAVPFAVGAWLGTRSGLRNLPPASAVAAGAGGALAVFVVLTLFSGRPELLSVVPPVAGVALGTGLALRANGRRDEVGAA